MAYAPGQVGTITIGGQTLSTTGLIILAARAGGANLRSTFRKATGSAGYQVTAGKTLTVMAVQIFTQTNSGNQGYHIAQTDNDAGIAGTTAFTNPVYDFGTSTNGAMGFPSDVSLANTNGSGAAGKQEYASGFQAAAGKFLSLLGDGTNAAIMYVFCYER